MTDSEAKQLLSMLSAAYPNQTVNDDTGRLYVAKLDQFAARDRQYIVDAVLAQCTFFPNLAELLRVATDVTVERIRSERVSQENTALLDSVDRFKLASGMTDEQAAANVQRFKAMTRDYLHRVNVAKAGNKGMLPASWQRTEPEEADPDRTRCPACNGNDPRCASCDGTGLVCPTCRGTRILSSQRTSSERPLYVGCPDCTDWRIQATHSWDEHGYPRYQRDPDRERHAIHAARSRRRAAA